MRVRCIDKGRSTILEVGEEYEVCEEVGDKYLIPTKWIGAVLYLKKYFEIIEEDKMEEIKIVRKLEDLDGLENGFGLKVSVYGHPLMIEVSIPFEDNIVLKKIVDKCGVETIHQIKAMGFKFEYKPLRTIEEVIAEMRTKEIQFTFNGDNWYVKHVASYNKYYVSYDCHDNIIGTIYLDKETAAKYCIELNEILKGGK